MNTPYFLKHETDLRRKIIRSWYSLTWVIAVVCAFLLLFVSIVFHTFLLFGIENMSVTTQTTYVSSPETIDQNQLSYILDDRTKNVADLPSEKSTALASVDPSK